ncbi:hypothetical protein P8452_56770 [Trifolium repens]|nr:hypothetical protein P8452_56770 [Trifolium repens]
MEDTNEPLAVTPNSLKLLVANLVESLSHWEFHSHASVGVQLQDRFMKTFVQLHQKLLLVCGLVRGKDIVEVEEAKVKVEDNDSAQKTILFYLMLGISERLNGKNILMETKDMDLA